MPGYTLLSEAVARNLYKLMAYKDEYEVARLHTDPVFLAQLDAQFKHGYSIQYNLAPPLISPRDAVTGELIKSKFGGWMMYAFKVLKHLKGLRGSILDVFGQTEERHQERALIDDFLRLMDVLIAGLKPSNHQSAVSLASVPDEIRGYGHVKAKSIQQAQLLYAKRLEEFHGVSPQALQDSESSAMVN
jgi:indolepyruvate ferredoxin oxidoreductase